MMFLVSYGASAKLLVLTIAPEESVCHQFVLYKCPSLIFYSLAFAVVS